jgi:uncharacterized protein YegL
MRQGLTELVFILDKSGSMGGLESDTIGGFNAMLSKQKSEPGVAIVTTVLFDNNYELLHDRTDIIAIPPITDKEYHVGGGTALIDAIGRTIQKVRNAQKHIADEYCPENTLFVIITDGAENASREYTSEQVKRIIEHQTAKYGWEFIFLGANIDAVETARGFGINSMNTQDFHADSKGLSSGYTGISAAVSAYRRTGTVGKGWKNIIASDFDSRKK